MQNCSTCPLPLNETFVMKSDKCLCQECFFKSMEDIEPPTQRMPQGYHHDILEVKELCDHLKANKPVIMNVEGVDTPLAQRMVDFLCGAVYCLDGDIQKISSGIFLATPASIEITGDLKDEMKNKGVFSWVK